MSRIATWRRAPSEPDTVRGWLLRANPLARDTPARNVGRLPLSALLIIGMNIAATPFLTHGGSLVFLGSFAASVVLSLLSWLRRRPTVVRGDGPGESVWISLAIWDRFEKATGGDVGWLIHSDGWLLFEGGRTAFALTRNEVSRDQWNGKGVLWIEDGRKIEFRLPHERPKRAVLDGLLAAWDTAPTPKGEAVLPPIATHPEGAAYDWNNRVAEVVLWSMGIAVSLLSGLWPIIVALYSIMAFVSAGRALAAAKRLRRDLRSLEALPDVAIREFGDLEPLTLSGTSEKPSSATVSPTCHRKLKA